MIKMKFERKVKLMTEEKYKLANKFLFGYAFDNDLYGEFKYKEILFQKDEEVMIYSEFGLKQVTIRTNNIREANNLEQELKRINYKE